MPIRVKIRVALFAELVQWVGLGWHMYVSLKLVGGGPVVCLMAVESPTCDWRLGERRERGGEVDSKCL